MAKYRFSALVTVSAFTEVEADTLEEARDIAEFREAKLDERGHGEDEFWIVEEADGEPYDIHHEE